MKFFLDMTITILLYIYLQKNNIPAIFKRWRPSKPISSEALVSPYHFVNPDHIPHQPSFPKFFV